MTAHDDRARDEQPAPGALPSERADGRFGLPHRCQPAPTVRETTADALLWAIDSLADPTGTPSTRLSAAGIARNEAELLRRERDAARAEVGRLREENGLLAEALQRNDGGARAELERLRTIAHRAHDLLAACDRNEQHIRENVPHLPPDGGSFSVHVIRKYLRGEDGS